MHKQHALSTKKVIKTKTKAKPKQKMRQRKSRVKERGNELSS